MGVHSTALAVILSFIIWGLGQIYVGKSIAKGVGLLIVGLVLSFISIGVIVGSGSSMSCWVLFPISLILTAFIMWDAYRDAIQHNKDVKLRRQRTQGKDVKQPLGTDKYVVDKGDIKPVEKKEEQDKIHRQELKLKSSKKDEEEWARILKVKGVNFCPHCGIKVEGNPNFCSNCGLKFMEEEQK